MSIWSKRITKDAAFWGMVTGFFMNVLPATIDYLGIYHMPEYAPPVIGTIASIVVILFVSRRGTTTRAEKVYRLRLHIPPASDIDPAKTRITLLAPLGLVAYGVGMPFIMLNYYVIPYQIGTGQILPDGSINWNTGEAIITLTIFLLHVPLALMAMKIIRDRYDPDSKRNRKVLRRASPDNPKQDTG